MNKQGLTTGEIVILFVGIIVIVGVFIPQIFDTQSIMTTKYAVDGEAISIASILNLTGGINGSNEAFNLANKPTADDWQWAGGCIAESFVLYNGSGTAMTNGVDYAIDTTYFNVTFNESRDSNYGMVGDNNDTTVDYTYCQDGYVQNGGARSIAGLIGLFSALALLAWILYYIKNEY